MAKVFCKKIKLWVKNCGFSFAVSIKYIKFAPNNCSPNRANIKIGTTLRRTPYYIIYEIYFMFNSLNF